MPRTGWHTIPLAVLMALTVGSLVLVDGQRPATLACDNDDGSWDCIFDDGTDEDAVGLNRLELAAAQPPRPTAPSGGSLAAAAASLRLSLTPDPAGEEGDTAAAKHMSRIKDGAGSESSGSLWLGSEQAARRRNWLRARGITAVLNVTRDVANVFAAEPAFEYHNLRCDDAESEAAALDAQLDAALARLSQWLDAGRHVLVHCHAGRSRSAAVVLAHLMYARRMGLQLAVEHVLARRAILPNAGFFEVLVRRQERWLAAAGFVPPPPGYHDQLTRRFVHALRQAADAMTEAQRKQEEPSDGGDDEDCSRLEAIF